jgi:putative endonuclease
VASPSLPGCHREARSAVAIQEAAIRLAIPRGSAEFSPGRAGRNVYYVYILTNQRNGTLYVGVTGDLRQRVWQHKNKAFGGFTTKYGVDRLVYFESFRAISYAIAREKQLKAGTRKKKLQLIEGPNPGWVDLAANWY